MVEFFDPSKNLNGHLLLGRRDAVQHDMESACLVRVNIGIDTESNALRQTKKRGMTAS
jgi:hypothetical protein